MDTPYGRFAVLIPSGLSPGTPLLVPVPASGAPTQIGSTVPNDPAVRKKEEAREAQLAALVERGFAPSEAAQYCDGTSSIEELVELMSSDEHALAQQASEDDDGLEDDADAGLVPALASVAAPTFAPCSDVRRPVARGPRQRDHVQSPPGEHRNAGASRDGQRREARRREQAHGLARTANPPPRVHVRHVDRLFATGLSGPRIENAYTVIRRS